MNFDVIQQVINSSMSQELRSKVSGLDTSILLKSNMDVELFFVCRLIKALIKHQYKRPSLFNAINKPLFEVRC